MRHNTLTLCVVVLVFFVGLSLGREFAGASHPAVAAGQSQNGTVLIAASNTQNEAFCFLFDPSTRQLASYKQWGKGGLELMGIRTCDGDFNPKIREYPGSESQTAVKNMKKLAERKKAGKKAGKKR